MAIIGTDEYLHVGIIRKSNDGLLLSYPNIRKEES